MKKKTTAFRVLAAIESHQWLIDDEYFQIINAIAQRESDLEAFMLDKELRTEINDFSSLMTTHDGQIEGTSAVKHGNRAVIPIIGPIFPRANLFTMISGGASIQTIARDTKIAASKGLEPLLYISSPGGVVEGVSEYAQMIASMGATAYVAGNCTSAAYWIASQCDSIILADTAIVGNIGVKGPNPKQGDDDSIVSDNAPNKKATPKMVKGIVNDLESVFLTAVSTGRNTTIEDVKQNFGQGGVFVGEKAVTARLADGVSTLDAFLTLSADQAKINYRKPEMAMTQEEKDAHAAELSALQDKLDAETARADAAEAVAGDDVSKTERERIAAILESAPDKPKAAMTMAMKTDMAADAAIEALKDMPVEASNDPLASAMNGTNPTISNDSSADQPDNTSQDDIDASWDDVIGETA